MLCDAPEIGHEVTGRRIHCRGESDGSHGLQSRLASRRPPRDMRCTCLVAVRTVGVQLLSKSSRLHLHRACSLPDRASACLPSNQPIAGAHLPVGCKSSKAPREVHETSDPLSDIDGMAWMACGGGIAQYVPIVGESCACARQERGPLVISPSSAASGGVALVNNGTMEPSTHQRGTRGWSRDDLRWAGGQKRNRFVPGGGTSKRNQVKAM